MEHWNQLLVFTLKTINERASIKRDGELINADTDGRDMLSIWARAKSTDPDKMSTKDIVAHTSATVAAGADTTAIALRAIIYYLCRNPNAMTKAVSEIDDADRRGVLGQSISYKEATNHLPYLTAAIKEAMRLHPSTGLMMERHVPSGGATICGQHIPGGTIVGINQWVCPTG